MARSRSCCGRKRLSPFPGLCKLPELSVFTNKSHRLDTVYDLETSAVLYPANFRIRRPTPAAAAATPARPAVPAPRDIGGGGDDAAPLAALALLGRLGAAAPQVEHAGAEGRRGARAEPIPGGDIHDDAAVPPSAAAAALREIRGSRHGVEEK